MKTRSGMTMNRLVSIVSILLLASCRAGGERQTLVHGVAPESLTALIELAVLNEDGGDRTVGILVRNPERIPVQSVRSWVRFDPSAVEVRDLAVSDGRFTLFAPGEKAIVPAEGFIKLGAAATKPLTDEELLLATFTVRVIRDRKPILAFHDWRPEGDGFTAVLSIDGRTIVNIVQAPSPLQL